MIHEMSEKLDGNLQPTFPLIARELGLYNSKNRLPWNQEHNFRLASRGFDRRTGFNGPIL
jgi:hypothetical protein